jgi:hypothetical protein
MYCLLTVCGLGYPSLRSKYYVVHISNIDLNIGLTDQCVRSVLYELQIGPKGGIPVDHAQYVAIINHY